MSKSERQAEHIAKLNALPQTEATRFKPGQIARNRSGAWVPCETCGTEIYKNTFRLQKSKHHFCSVPCKDRESPVRDEVVRLYKQGLKIREIAATTGRTQGTVSGMLHQARMHERWGTGTSLTAGRNRARKHVPKHCELCGYTRVVEVAHVVPRAKGGTYDPSNVHSLCPNCHHLFDHGMLTEDEQRILQEIRDARKE